MNTAFQDKPPRGLAPREAKFASQPSSRGTSAPATRGREGRLYPALLGAAVHFRLRQGYGGQAVVILHEA